MLRFALAFLAVITPAVSAQVLNVGTLAGTTRGGGYIDARGTAARFSTPCSVAIDSAGNVFVADSGNHVIRRITPAGDVSTFAGTPHIAGSADGKPGSFSSPMGVTIDKVTNELYVADTGNSTIRKVTADGTISTVAGTPGRTGWADGSGSAALFRNPRGIAVAPNGAIYVADTGNSALRRVTLDGAVLTISNEFTGAEGVAVDPASGAVYVAATVGGGVFKVTSFGKVTALAVAAVGPDFFAPTGIAVDRDGNVVFSDWPGHRIFRITPDGVLTTIAGAKNAAGNVDANGTSARLFEPAGIAFDDAGTLYIAERLNEDVRRMTPSRDVTTLAGTSPVATDFTFPRSVACDLSGNTYVVDATNTLKKIAPAGGVTTLAGLANTPGSRDGTGNAARFNDPESIAVDRRDGSVIVADTGNSTIRRVTARGIVTTIAGKAGTTGSADGTGSAATFDRPRGVAVDGSGTIYVADYGNGKIRKITAGGVVTTFVEKSLWEFVPLALAVDGAGNVYVADGWNWIDKITPDGVIGTFAGSHEAGWSDLAGTAARFMNPFGVAADAGGNLYVVDFYNHAIRRITPSGDVTTVAGFGSRTGNVNGFGSATRFSYPRGITVAPDGRVIVADLNNHAIRVGTVLLSGRPRPTRP